MCLVVGVVFYGYYVWVKDWVDLFVVLDVQVFGVQFEIVVVLGLQFVDVFYGEFGWVEVVEGNVWILVVLVEGYLQWQVVLVYDVVGFVEVVQVFDEQVDMLYVFYVGGMVEGDVMVGFVVQFGVEEVGVVFVGVCVVLVEVYQFDEEGFQFGVVVWCYQDDMVDVVFVGDEVVVWVFGNE